MPWVLIANLKGPRGLPGNPATEWFRGALGGDVQPSTITEPGVYMRSGGISDTLGWPETVTNSNLVAMVELVWTGAARHTGIMTCFLYDNGAVREYTRAMVSSQWQPWRASSGGGSGASWFRGVLGGSVQPSTIVEEGVYMRSGGISDTLGWPESSTTSNLVAKVELVWTGVGRHTGIMTCTIYDNGSIREYTRFMVGGQWQPWQSGGGGSVAASWPPRPSVETTGEWTTLAEELALLKRLGQHREAEYMEIGTSVQGRKIPALRIGFKNGRDDLPRPTVLVTAGVHGSESGAREGALRFAREVIEAKSLARHHVSVIIVPNVNPDGALTLSRNNANDVNLNRDFIANTQPETQAVRSLIEREHIIAAVDLHNGGAGERINFVEPRATGVAAPVMERSGRMFEAVWEAILDADQEPFRYPYPPDEAGLFSDGMASVYRIPSLLMEIPYINGVVDRPDVQVPPRVWMAYGTTLLCHAVVDVAWRERNAFAAAKANTAYTIPERYKTAIEIGRNGTPRSTGWRDITSLIPNRTTGALRIMRVGAMVHLEFDELGASEQGNGWQTWTNVIPAGFRPPRTWTYAPIAPRSDAHAKGPMRVNTAGAMLVYDAQAERRMLGLVSWPTSDPWPSTLPGVAV